MSMYQSAERLNTDLKGLFNSLPIEQFTITQREEILNIMLRFGAVAKYRCRSNTAYDNFCAACFKDISAIDRVKKDDDSDFTVLRATMPKKQPDLFEGVL